MPSTTLTHALECRAAKNEDVTLGLHLELQLLSAPLTARVNMMGVKQNVMSSHRHSLPALSIFKLIHDPVGVI